MYQGRYHTVQLGLGMGPYHAQLACMARPLHEHGGPQGSSPMHRMPIHVYAYMRTHEGGRGSEGACTSACLHACAHVQVTVEVAFLKSYENMGRARLTCAGDCHCPEKLLDGHHTHRASQSYLEPVRVSQAESCLLVVTVLNVRSTHAWMRAWVAISAACACVQP